MIDERSELRMRDRGRDSKNVEVVESKDMPIRTSFLQARGTVKDQDTSDRTSVVEDK
jgi:hypothetical protein